jgi:hypothetical protein
MSRKLLSSWLVVAALFGVAQIPETAAASTVTYDLTLTPNAGSGGEGGSGSFTVTTPKFPGSVYDTKANGSLISMSFTIDNQTFTLADASSAGVGFSQSGSKEVINNISFSGSLGDFTLFLSTGGFTYSFVDSKDYRLDTNGTISASVPSTPLPTSWSLFGAGALVLAGFLALRRRAIGPALNSGAAA